MVTDPRPSRGLTRDRRRIETMTPTGGLVLAAVLIGLGLLVLMVKPRGSKRAAGLDRMAGYLLLFLGVCTAFVSLAARGA
jgi:hypothetical protein